MTDTAETMMKKAVEALWMEAEYQKRVMGGSIARFTTATSCGEFAGVFDMEGFARAAIAAMAEPTPIIRQTINRFVNWEPGYEIGPNMMMEHIVQAALSEGSA